MVRAREYRRTAGARLQKKDRQSARRNSLQQWAQNKLNAHISKGLHPKAVGLPCADCGEPAQCWDHRDYYKPLKVEAVCRKCNAKRGPARGADAYLLPLKL